jgi:nicotinate-nucleotide pyrophosphorylase (carboxylating)
MRDHSALSLPQLLGELLPGDAIDRLIRSALDEDLGGAGDVTSQAMIEPDQRGSARLVPREGGVIAGVGLLAHVHDPRVADVARTARVLVKDGQSCTAGQPVATLSGNLRAILAFERTLLNLIGRLSGIATLTSKYVAAVAGTKAVICDTRKTTPGLRRLEKYAVRCGGATMHRLGLFDAMLIKDNHLASIERRDWVRGVEDAIRSARASNALTFVEIEVDSIAQLKSVLRMQAGLVDMVLLDNMSPRTLRRAVAIRDETGAGVQLEASGGVNLRNVRRIAETGVDRISVGAITHSAPSLDIGLDFP